jgi:hypothetical protein
MKHNIVAAAVLGLCLVIAALIFSGRYYALRLDGNTAIVVDRWTGKTTPVQPHQKWWEF